VNEGVGAKLEKFVGTNEEKDRTNPEPPEKGQEGPFRFFRRNMVGVGGSEKGEEKGFRT